MGRRTFDNLQFKERRRTGVQAQLFALRRALAAKAQLVKNQQQQIDILGRELANACVRIAVLERNAVRAEGAWEAIADLAHQRVTSWHGHTGVDLEQIAFDHLTDGVHDPQLHPSEAHARIDATLQRVQGRMVSLVQQFRDQRAQTNQFLETTVRLTRETMQRIRDATWSGRLHRLRTRLALLPARLAGHLRRFVRGARS